MAGFWRGATNKQTAQLCYFLYRSPSRPNTAEKDPNNTAKLKALNATILRLTESNQRMQSENKLLKQDLERALDEAMSDLGDTPRAKKRRDRKRGWFGKCFSIFAEFA